MLRECTIWDALLDRDRALLRVGTGSKNCLNTLYKIVTKYSTNVAGLGLSLFSGAFYLILRENDSAFCVISPYTVVFRRVA
jgi:hypothetical protein